VTPERDEALDQFLSRLRREAGLSLAEVCDRTKIQPRYVQALEDGHYGELPSNTHLRAFSIALTKACGGSEEHAGLLVRQVLHQVAAPVEGAGVALLSPPPPASPSAPLPAAAGGSGQAPSAPRTSGPAPVLRERAMAAPMAAAVAVPQVDPLEAADGLVQGASQKLKALPWQALLLLSLGAALLSGLLLWGVQRFKNAPAEITAPETAAAAPAPAQPGKAGVPAVAAAAAETAPAAAAMKLTLRARRPCWLVLEIDGQKLPTITLEDGDKRSWDVNSKAVLLAGNLGALRVWWNNDNMGYLGELGQRSNGLVFEPGKMPRTDKNSALPLPAGVPE
jgi:hypothetical protein